MTPEQEDEVLVYVAAGIDPLTAVIMTASNDDSPSMSVGNRSEGKKGSGCLFMFLLAFFLLCVLGPHFR